MNASCGKSVKMEDSTAADKKFFVAVCWLAPGATESKRDSITVYADNEHSAKLKAKQALNVPPGSMCMFMI